MGRDKGSLAFGDETMLDRVTRVAGLLASEVIVVGRSDQQGITVRDSMEDQGPLMGFAAGISASRSELNLLIACDMPLIKAAVLQRLLDDIGEHDDACVAVVDGRESVLCGVYRKRPFIMDKIHALLDSGQRSMMGFIDAIQTKRVDAAVFRDIDPDLESFISVDTPEKYTEALSRSLRPDP
jgi:molybdenum cofactor guanylyltransferase